MTERNKAVTAVAATTSAGMVMLAVILLSTKYLGPSEQGFFFAFMSFGVLVQVGDFGLSYAVMQKASHLTHSSIDVLQKFEAQARRWGLLTAALSTTAVGIFGSISFHDWSANPRLQVTEWGVAWGLALASLFCGQCATPILSLMEGSGKITRAWRIRMLQEWVGGIACAIALILGWKLFGIALYWAGRALISLPLLFLRIYDRDSRPDFPLDQNVNWRKDMWPFQWRMGLSNLSGFLIFRASIIVILAEQGPIATGQYGLALAAMNMMLSVTASWPNSQAARFGQLLAAKKCQTAIAEAKSTLRLSTIFAFTSTAAVLSLFGIAAYLDLDISRRMTDLVTLTIVLATGLAHHLVACQAVLLRAYAKEPLLAISVIGGIANIIGAFVAAHFGTLPIIATVALACALIGLSVSTHLFVTQCKKWIYEECEFQNT